MGTEGKVVVITGAKGGLGTTVTEAFLAAGATVVGISRSIKQADFAHKSFAAVQADFSSGVAVSQAAKDSAIRFGRVDALVHVMGGFAGGTVAETDDETWRRMLDPTSTRASTQPAPSFLICARPVRGG